jgi:hypothetical protein
LESLFIDPHQLFAFARMLAKDVVSDAIEPGGKLRFAAKASDVFVSADERFLRKIIGQLHVRARELAEQAAHGRLMSPHQLAERVLVAINNNACEQVRITQLHIIC